jgi:NADH-quinone oxidoreductase subunit L
LLSGFWSKDQILESTLEAGHGRFGGVYLFLFAVALFTALLTAFYTARAYFLTFWGETKLPPEAEGHAAPVPIDTHGEKETTAEVEAHGHGHAAHSHEPSVMTVPLIVLSIGAVFAGLVFGPLTGWFADFLGGTDLLTRANRGQVPEGHHTNWALVIGSSAVAILGVAAAWWVYRRKPGTADAVARRFAGGYQLSLNRLYVDEIYQALFVRPLAAVASVCRGLEALVFDVVRLIAAAPGGLARLVRPMQNGLVQFYGLSMAMGLAAFLFYLIVWAGR